MTRYDTSKQYIQYIEDVLSGKEVAGWFVKKACERAKSWFERDDIELRYDEIDRKIKLVQKIKQKKGLQAGKPFLLLPFQQFIFMSIFGWYYVGTEKRVTRNVLLMMARQTGKSYIAAAIALAIALDKTLPAPTVDYIANSAKQAAIAFGHCKDQCSSLDPKGKIFHRFRSEIRVPLTGASINVLSSDTSKLDGRASYFVADEIHENKDWKIWEIMASGQGSLKNPLAIGISTAGWWASEDYPLYSMWSQAKQTFEGNITDDSWFYLIFQLDEEDDWKDPAVWKKSIPTLGIAVDEDYIKGRIQEAINNPMKEVEIKVKNLNIWCNSAQTWITNEQIKKVTKKFTLSDFNKEEDWCLVGFDLSETGDLTAVTTLIHKFDKYWFKAYCFVPRTGLENSPNKELYNHWIRKGYLTLIDEPIINQEFILKCIEDINDEIPIAYIAYDPWRARQLANKLMNEGLPVHKISQSIGQFSEATQELYNLILTEQVYIDDNPIIRWMFANVLIKEDANQNKKPIKSSRNAKIDAVVAFIQTVKLWIEINGATEAADEVSILEN